MELALYCPESGYYERSSKPVGRRGDFVTSVSIGPLFGQLLASQFAAWCEDFSGPVHWVEAGAHDGTLARDILESLRERHPALFTRLAYVVVEPSETRSSWQKSSLNEFGDTVRWKASLAEIETETCFGVIFSNELFDAFPFHRLGWDAATQRWFEWGIDIEQGRFHWCRLEQPEHQWSEELAVAGFKFPPELLEVLPDGYVMEVCPAARHWWIEAARVLARGRLLAIDYGMLADQFISPERRAGTLRAYRRQSVTADVLASPGEQDLTAHVNFTQFIRAGESAGLKTEIFSTQSEFLMSAARLMWGESARPGASEIRQFQSLTHPEQLGRSFRVLVQSRLG